ITFRPHFSLRAGENTSFTLEENGTGSLNLQIAQSPFESVSQYNLTFNLKGRDHTFSLEDDLPDVDGNGQIRLSGLTFHKLLEGGSEDLLGYKWDGEGKNLTFTLSMDDADPLVFPSFHLPLDYSVSLKAGEINLLSADKHGLAVGETRTVEARLGADLAGFSCKLLVIEQDNGGLPAQWKEEAGKFVLKGAHIYEAFSVDLLPDKEDPLLHKGEFQLGVRDGIYDLGGEETASVDTYEWSVIFLVYKSDPHPGNAFVNRADSVLCEKSNTLALVSRRPVLSRLSCTCKTLTEETEEFSEVTRHHISYTIGFDHLVKIPNLNGQALSLVQLTAPEALAGNGSAMTVLTGIHREDKNENALLSGTIILNDREGLDLSHCRLHLNLSQFLCSAEHCKLPDGRERVVSQGGSSLAKSGNVPDSDTLGILVPIE
ncbi:MAG: hypothetical protein PQJ60_04240, partial [Spirochaetales bacterium]|nr:hypothetical protein [Spirochaetales bacterium]